MTELCQSGCNHPINTHSSRGCEHHGCACLWAPLGSVLKRMLPETRENELREALGYVKLTYTGPILSSDDIRQVQRGVTEALDGMGLPTMAPSHAAIMAGTIENGIVEITVRVPVDLLKRTDADDLPSRAREAQLVLERAAFGTEIRKTLRGTFRKWRDSDSDEDPTVDLED